MNWKNTLLLAAAMPTYALSQTASTDVQVYGRLDASVNMQKFSGTSGTKNAISSDTSLIGFRGTEDLGGGLAAYFKLESGLQLDTGVQNNATRLWNREALVGLRDAKLGSVQLGIQWNPVLWLTAATDPFGRAQTGAQFTFFQGTGVRGYLGQYLNAVQYISPTVSGFTGRLMASMPEGALAKNYGASLTYAQGPLYIGAAYDDVQTAGAGVGLPLVADTRSQTLAVGATYQMAIAKLFGYVQNNRVPSLGNVTGYLVGATVPAGVGEFRVSALHTNRASAEASLLAVGYSYYFSKRSQIYTSAARLSNEGTARFSMWPGAQDFGAAGAPTAGQDIAGIQIGMRHTY